MNALEAVNRLAAFYKAKLELSEQQTEKIRQAVLCLAKEYVPNEASLAQIALGDHDEPSIVALHAGQLYLLSAAVPDGDNATGKLRSFYVAADAETVQFEASSEQGTSATWRFKLTDGRGDDLRLSLDGQERKLAAALADALGWKLPGESAPDATD